MLSGISSGKQISPGHHLDNAVTLYTQLKSNVNSKKQQNNIAVSVTNNISPRPTLRPYVQARCDSPLLSSPRAPGYLAQYCIVCQPLKFLVASVCDLPDVINCQFQEFAAAPSGPLHFL